MVIAVLFYYGLADPLSPKNLILYRFVGKSSADLSYR